MAAPILTAFGRWLSGLAWEQIPALSRQAARLQTLDMIAAAAAGRRAGHTTSVLEARAAWSGEPTGAARLVGGGSAAPPDAAFVNAAWSMAHDYDDIVWLGHPCHSAVFAALAVAEQQGASDRALLGAIVAANELAGRLGASCMLGPLNGQMWTFIHLLGAAAAAARLLELDPTAATHALAIALAQPPFALQPGFMTPTSKLLAAATPAATGMRAAYLARAGMTGAPDIIEDRRGLWSRFSYLPLEPMVGRLGRFWVSETLAVKTYPGCHYFQTACTAIARLIGRLGPSPDDIAAVRIETTKLALEATRFAAEYRGCEAVTPVAVQFDLSVAAAVMLLAGRLGPAELEPSWLKEHAGPIRSLAARVTVQHDPALTLRTLESMAAVGAGRAALATVRPADVVRMVRRYRTEYRSTLLPATELGAWLGALGALTRKALGRRRRSGTRAAARAGGVPLCFPSRVHIRLESGAEDSERIDLPEGSLCAPTMPGVLADKVRRELAPAFGSAGAARVLELGLGLGRERTEQPLTPLLEALAPPHTS